MRPTPTLAAIVGGLLTCTLLAPPTAADAKPNGQGPTERTVTDGTTTFTVVTNPNGGATLSYIAGGPVKLLKVRSGKTTLAFKDMNANGKLDTWEDWRKSIDERAKAPAQEVTI